MCIISGLWERKARKIRDITFDLNIICVIIPGFLREASSIH